MHTHFEKPTPGDYGTNFPVTCVLLTHNAHLVLYTCIYIHVYIYMYTGGIGGFMLSVFHKLETSKKTRKLQNLPALKRTEVYCLCVIRGNHSPSVYATMHVLVCVSLSSR